VRLGTQFSLVKRGDFKALEAVASNPKAQQLARIHAIWGLGQGLRAAEGGSQRCSPSLLTDSDPEILTQTAKMLGDVKTDGKPLIPLLAHGKSHAFVSTPRSPSANSKKCLSAEKASRHRREDESADPFMRHAIVTGLAGCASESNLARM
jgi:quinoprotein glucose dehydrogenase